MDKGGEWLFLYDLEATNLLSLVLNDPFTILVIYCHDTFTSARRGS